MVVINMVSESLAKRFQLPRLRGSWMAVALVATSLCAACGGETGERPQPTQTSADTDPCLDVSKYEVEVLQDFEKPKAPEWGIFGDRSPGSSVTPSGATSTTETITDGARCGTSTSALHIIAQNMTKWGGSLQHKFPENLDASQWDGISFWARKGPDAPGQTLYLVVTDPNTVSGDFCQDAESTPLTEKCDPYAQGTLIETQWKMVNVPFKVMKQRGWGKTAPALMVEKLVGLQIAWEVGNWDIWIDDVSLFKGASR